MSDTHTKRKLVAVIAVRCDSSRLYAKPLQNLVPGLTILDQILDTFEAFPQVINTSVIAIAEGRDNLVYEDFAQRRGVPYLFGSKPDILKRLTQGGELVGATDVLRITSENPYLWWEKFEQAWAEHLAKDNDLTVADGCPLGAYFEIMRMPALQTAEQHASGYEREACTQYFRNHGNDFRIHLITPDNGVYRTDVRLTVDNPEDLVVARRIYEQHAEQAPLIPMADIIRQWDEQPFLRELVAPFNSGNGIWVNNAGCDWQPGGA